MYIHLGTMNILIFFKSICIFYGKFIVLRYVVISSVENESHTSIDDHGDTYTRYRVGA